MFTEKQSLSCLLLSFMEKNVPAYDMIKTYKYWVKKKQLNWCLQNVGNFVLASMC